MVYTALMLYIKVNNCFNHGRICWVETVQDRAKINRDLNLFVLWEMENWISGAADGARQHGAVMAFIPIKSRVNVAYDIWKYTLQPIAAAFLC